jgi:hypothetical protein
MRAESLGTLPGEISPVRAREKSAEAVVARKRLKGRGVKGRRSRDATHRLPSEARSDPKPKGVATAAASRRVALGDAWWIQEQPRLRVASRVSGRHPVRCVDGGKSSERYPPLAPTAGCGRPHVRWCGRGNGLNPVASTRSECRRNRRDSIGRFRRRTTSGDMSLVRRIWGMLNPARSSGDLVTPRAE